MMPKGSRAVVTSVIRTIFAGLDRERIEQQFAEVATELTNSHPQVAAMLDLKTMNTQIEPAKEVNIVPELVSA